MREGYFGGTSILDMKHSAHTHVKPTQSRRKKTENIKAFTPSLLILLKHFR